MYGKKSIEHDSGFVNGVAIGEPSKIIKILDKRIHVCRHVLWTREMAIMADLDVCCTQTYSAWHNKRVCLHYDIECKLFGKSTLCKEERSSFFSIHDCNQIVTITTTSLLGPLNMFASF